MSSEPGYGHRPLGPDETAAANRAWWDAEAPGYLAEHGAFLGDDDLVWGPEGWSEAELGLLGDLEGRRVLEIGSGAAQGGRWVASRAGEVVSTDLSLGMLTEGAGLNLASRSPVALLQCDAARLPFAEEAFDVVFTAYGAVPFVADSAGLMAEVARVLVPGGLFAFSTTHPIRWSFPDLPGEEGLTAGRSYWDRTPYVETDGSGRATYAEHHRTLGDRIREITAAGLNLLDVVEPEWPSRNAQEWGGWSPTRGRVIPGTAIFVCRRGV